MNNQFGPSVSTRAGVLVLGTDTGVGKTKVSAGLVHGLAQRGCRVAGLKPVVSGAVDWQGAPAGTAPVWEDVLALEQAGGLVLPATERSVVMLQAPASPHFAAREQGVSVDFADLVRAIQRSAVQAQALVVEGVGGARVPLNAQFDTADLAVALGLPVVLVVGLRLGCINHALLTAEALRARGLVIASWVANAGVAPYERIGETIDTIATALNLACSATLPVLSALPTMQWHARVVYREALAVQAQEAAAALSGTLDVLQAGCLATCFT